jgi:large subunit ribosomal protein L9
MKVILLHDVPGLGKPGDVKEVAPGYARNYLLPRQLVTAATQTELASLQERVAAAQRRAAKQRQTSEDLAARIGAVVLTFAVRVGQGGRLYGSVTSQNIADALREQEGLTVDRRLIQLREPLRQLGEFEIGVRVASGVEPKVRVRIVSADSAEATGEGVEPTAAETPADGEEPEAE